MKVLKKIEKDLQKHLKSKKIKVFKPSKNPSWPIIYIEE
jgi:hypothetical protein